MILYWLSKILISRSVINYPKKSTRKGENKLSMRINYSLLLLILFTAACQSSVDQWPEDLEGKKKLLKTKRQELASLTKEVDQLQTEINTLEPNLANQGKLVTTSLLAKRDFEHFVEIQGTVRPGKTVNIAAEVPGQILQVAVEEGDRVIKGQLIAELDLEQITKQMEEVEVALSLANTVYERQKRLWEQNIGSEIQFLEAENNKERLEKNMDALRVQMRRSKIFSPITGVVDRKALEPGEYASPGMPIVQLIDLGDLRVAADVPETYLRAVRIGKEVRVSFPALDMEQNARVSLIGNTINNANRTFKVEAKVNNRARLLKPNLLSIMYLQDFAEEDVVVVAQELVQQEVSGKDYVFVKEDGPDGPISRKKYVVTGSSYNNEVVIREGLTGGEEIIIQGARGLTDGQSIRIQETKTEAHNG